MRRGLFWRFYATLLVSLVLTALAIGLLGRAFADGEQGWPDAQRRFVEAIVPAADAPHAETQRAVARLAEGIGGEIALFASSGRPIARAIAKDASKEKRGGKGREFEVALSDGRIVRAVLPGRSGPGFAVFVGVVALVVGLGAWPVVAQLTRRLERVRAGVELWGAGALSTRVAAEGRDEVGAVGTAFNAAADRIERLLAAHLDLLAHASHELRSPLARLRMTVELNREALSADADAEIVRDLAEMDELIEGILLSSRLEHDGGATRTREPVDLLALAAEEAARVGAEVDGASVTIEGDPRLLRRMLRNLLENAGKHGAPPIAVEVGPSVPDAAFVRVRDAGPGIAAADRDRIFDRFTQASASPASAASWGLGLALVRQIAEHHGGSVRYEDAPGDGAAFVVLLPLE